MDDIPASLKDQIRHFFEQYKTPGKDKWAGAADWAGIDAAHHEIDEGAKNFKIGEGSSLTGWPGENPMLLAPVVKSAPLANQCLRLFLQAKAHEEAT